MLYINSLNVICWEIKKLFKVKLPKGIECSMSLGYVCVLLTSCAHKKNSIPHFLSSVENIY